MFASDLMQCFDKIAHPVYSLVSRRMGVPKSVIQCTLLTIQQIHIECVRAMTIHYSHMEITERTYSKATDKGMMFPFPFG